VRVISGNLKGKKLFSIKGLSLRPTSDRVREAIFDILQNEIAGKRILDLFAGTGALGIEALSRGASSAVFVENSPKSLSALQRNLTECRLQGISSVLNQEIAGGIGFLERQEATFELIFLDPPYGKGLARKTLEALAESPVVTPETLMVAEHSPDEDLEAIPHLEMVDQRKYGGTRVSFLRRKV
jgi:16S rRNA (guanine966-N2)-methyltransferase